MAWVVASAALLTAARLAQACDLCAIYTTTEGREEPGFHVGVAEQYTYFGTLKQNSETVPNPFGERLRSSITQLIAGYTFVPRFGMQINFPIISRSFRRVESSGVMDGDESGIGDMSVIATVRALSWVNTEIVAHLYLFGGLKFPTGDPAALSEETDPSPPPCILDPSVCHLRTHLRLRPDIHPHHSTGPASGIHGHDLALGSGSVDGIVGGQAFGSWRRAFATASIQYLARTVGAFDYQYANELLFEGGPGVYLLLGDNWLGEAYALGAQVLLTGETKGNDTLAGEKETDTAITALYVGPAFRFSWGTHLFTEITADLPVLQHNTGLQIVPDYRLRGGITWRF
jgi:hypothetical protein